MVHVRHPFDAKTRDILTRRAREGHRSWILQGAGVRTLGPVASHKKRVIIATMARSPSVARADLGFAQALSGGTLPRRLREPIALVVGEANACGSCLAAHTASGKRAGLSDQETKEARRATSVDAKEQAALVFARKVVQDRGVVADADVEQIRRVGSTRLDQELGFQPENWENWRLSPGNRALLGASPCGLDPSHPAPSRCPGWVAGVEAGFCRPAPSRAGARVTAPPELGGWGRSRLQPASPQQGPAHPTKPLGTPGRARSDLESGMGRGGLSPLGSEAQTIPVTDLVVGRATAESRALRTKTHGFRGNADQSDNRRPRSSLGNPASVDPTDRSAQGHRLGCLETKDNGHPSTRLRHDGRCSRSPPSLTIVIDRTSRSG